MASQQRFLPLPFFLALAGILFSLWNALGDASALCVTEGCSLFSTYTLAGVSLWWAGVAGFGLLLLLAIPGLAAAGMVCAGLGLVLDCLLLLVMLFTAPCFNCLIIGLLLALTFVSYRAAARRDQRRRADGSLSPLLTVWILLFIVDVGCLARESLDPWALVEPSDGSEAAVRVYFSPSCAACVSLVRSYDEARSGSAAWYPVAENERDLMIIADMRRRMAEDGPEGGASLAAALDASLAAAPVRTAPSAQLSPGALLLQFRLWRNAARVLDAGSDRLPFVEFHGAPAVLQTPPQAAETATSPAVPDAVTSPLPFLNVTGFCDGGDAPCDEPVFSGAFGSSAPSGASDASDASDVSRSPISLDSLMRGEHSE